LSGEADCTLNIFFDGAGLEDSAGSLEKIREEALILGRFGF
jgi:hypothetical protein